MIAMTNDEYRTRERLDHDPDFAQGYRFIAAELDGEPKSVRQATARALDEQRKRIDNSRGSHQAAVIDGALAWITEHA